MITPKYVHQARAAIEKQRLIQEDFEVTSSHDKLRIEYKKADFYFLFGWHTITPPTKRTFIEAADFALRPCSIEYKPNELSPGDLSPVNSSVKNFKYALIAIDRWLAWIKEEYGPFETRRLLAKNEVKKELASPFAHLHPAVQQAASSRFASLHYSDAVEKACIALEKVVRDKANQPSDLGGTDLMNRVFSQANPLITLSPDKGEREGYMFLFRGMWQALRNHHAHNATSIDPTRALEWLCFISALFYKLDETLPAAAPPLR